MRRLDSAQLAAATDRASIQLTLAGPGSGKTSTLTGRFVHLIRQGVDPARVLAVTFTKKSADEMRRAS
jgi:DNA helicase-2/ATP-dependent DNA helicase PcrA